MITYEEHDGLAVLALHDVVTPEDYREVTIRLDELLERCERIGVVLDVAHEHRSASGAKKAFVQWMLARQALLTERVAASAEVVAQDLVEPGRRRLAASPLPWPAELFADRTAGEQWVRRRLS